MSFLAKTQTAILAPEGSIKAKIALIGDTPNAYDLKERKLFAGPVGRILEQCLHSAGLTRSELYITYVSRSPKQASNIDQDDLDELRDELSQTNANIFIPVGEYAMKALVSDREKIHSFRGYIFESTLLPGRKVIGTIHPSVALRGNYIFRHYISHDFHKARKQSLFSDIKYPECDLIIPDNYADAIGWLQCYQKKNEISIDIEVINHEVSCIAFCSDFETSVSIPYYHSGKPIYSEEEEVELWTETAKIFEDDTIVKIGQNFIFDMQFLLAQNGIITATFKDEKSLIKDTMIAHHILYPDFLKGLGFLASIYTDWPYWKDMVHWKGSDLTKGDG